jgi:hypothetical protein
VDVWASQEDFARFGAVLMLILAEVGIEVGTPDIQPEYYRITGE